MPTPHDPADRPPVEPYRTDDPLCFPELSETQRAYRLLLAVLADTGAVITIPHDLAPQWTPMEIAAGWTLRPRVVGDAESGTLSLSAVRVQEPWLPHSMATGGEDPSPLVIQRSDTNCPTCGSGEWICATHLPAVQP